MRATSSSCGRILKTSYVSGLEKTLRSVFPIMDFAGTAHLDFDHYELEDPKYDTDECRQRGLTYAAPMRVTLRLTTFEIDPETEARRSVTRIGAAYVSPRWRHSSVSYFGSSSS